MAGPRTRRNTGRALTDDSGTPKSTPAVSCIPTSAPAQAPAPAPAFVLGLLARYTDKDLQKANKLALKLFIKGQKHGQANSAPRDRAFKARKPEHYYKSLHMEYYYFCR